MEKRPFDLTKVEAAAVYEGLTLLSLFVAKHGKPSKLPYSVESVDALRERMFDTWPEIRELYA